MLAAVVAKNSKRIWLEATSAASVSRHKLDVQASVKDCRLRSMPGEWWLSQESVATREWARQQLIEEAQVLFIGTLDYFELDAVESSPAMVVLLTQLSSLNYELLTGKFQLNVETGDVALSVEQRVGAGLSFGTFDEMGWHLVRTADEHHPMLEAIAAGTLH